MRGKSIGPSRAVEHRLGVTPLPVLEGFTLLDYAKGISDKIDFQVLEDALSPTAIIWEPSVIIGIAACILAAATAGFLLGKYGSKRWTTAKEADKHMQIEQALDALAAAEQRRLTGIVEQFPEGVALLNAEGNVVLTNRKAKEHLGILCEGDWQTGFTKLGNYTLQGLLESPPGGGLYHEIELTNPTRRVFEAAVRQIEIGHEAPGWLLMLRDATREREVQQRAQRQEQLAAVGQLAAGIAHDFNNLLMGMIGFGQLLQMRPGMPEAAKRDLERIVELGQRAAHIVRQILDFSRTSISERNTFDLASFVKETTKFLQRTIPENIHFSLEISPNPRGYLVDADPSQIRQVITNLALNSRDAMPQGGELCIRLSRFSSGSDEHGLHAGRPQGDWLELSISDNGTGISVEILPHIFEPFFTTKEVGLGTGIGMAQAYGIVNQHDGYLDVKSDEKHGTTVSIVLPAITPPGACEDGGEKGGASAVLRGCGESIMLVEDEAEVLHIGKQMLESLGYRVVAASNGNEALVLYERQKNEIALVITDMVMPEMSGMELLRELRARNPVIKAIMLTGYPMEDNMESLCANGFVGRLQKPVNISRMAQAVSQAIAQSSSRISKA
jgi:signal transduction histidine kinase/CheY-like chemotaxis protein